MLWVIILYDYKFLSYKLCSRWDHVMLQYAVVAGLIQFVLLLVQTPNFAIGKKKKKIHTITDPPPFFMVGVIQGFCTSFTNSWSLIDLSI